MYFLTSVALLFLPTFLLQLVAALPHHHRKAIGCTYAAKVAAIQHEIDTIGDHSSSTAAKIPLTATASRTFWITPAQFGGDMTLPPVNVGLTAGSVRTELVLLGNILHAAVPPKSVKYIANANGSVTVDFIQTDQMVLPRVQVREIHYFDESTCEISMITGFVNGPIACPTTSNNPVLELICSEYTLLATAADILEPTSRRAGGIL